MSGSSKGKIALVTGGGSGIGRAAALALQSVGYHVVIVGRREDALVDTANDATPGGGQMVAIQIDVSDEHQVHKLFQHIELRFGRLDLLFNNAGMAARAVPIDELSIDEWKDVVAVNLTGAFLCAREAVRLMKVQRPKGGRIINNGSISAITPRPFSAPYTATKHAMTGLTKSLSLDGRADDIACSQIDIGNADTDLTKPMARGVLQANGSREPEPRMDVQHVADAIVYMATLPLDANVQFMTVMATKMPFIGRG
jgi:NAD(P)-dependent dehydrogenase (short-subunit alcohol dehydrogenase family)